MLEVFGIICEQEKFTGKDSVWKVFHVQNKQEGSQDTTLRNTGFNWEETAITIVYRYKLVSVCDISFEPQPDFTTNVKSYKFGKKM